MYSRLYDPNTKIIARTPVRVFPNMLLNSPTAFTNLPEDARPNAQVC